MLCTSNASHRRILRVIDVHIQWLRRMANATSTAIWAVCERLTVRSLSPFYARSDVERRCGERVQ